jgi:hypothetical protein
MLYKREVDIVNGVTPAQGTHLTAIEIGYRSDYDQEAPRRVDPVQPSRGKIHDLWTSPVRLTHT